MIDIFLQGISTAECEEETSVFFLFLTFVLFLNP